MNDVEFFIGILILQIYEKIQKYDILLLSFIIGKHCLHMQHNGTKNIGALTLIKFKNFNWKNRK